MSSGWAFVPFFVFAVLNIWVGRRWLRLFVSAHPGIAPGYSWVMTRDADRDVERWRRVRLVVVIGELVAVAYLIYALTALG